MPIRNLFQDHKPSHLEASRHIFSSQCRQNRHKTIKLRVNFLLLDFYQDIRSLTPNTDRKVVAALSSSKGWRPVSNAAALKKPQQHQDKTFGGAERDRTADPLLAKQVLSQLSYSPTSHRPTGPHLVTEGWAREDLNFRPHAYQACALTN